MPSAFPEMREADASGEIADIYDQLRRGLRLPVVNLIYRHFATIPGALQFVWSRLHQPVLNGWLDRARMRVAAMQGIGNAFRLAPVRSWATTAPLADRAEIVAISDIYNRGNLANLIGLTAVRMLLDDSPPTAPVEQATVKPASNPPLAAIRPLPLFDALPASTAARVRALAAHHSGAGSGVTPSLYLHLAYWPGFVAALEEGLTPAFADGSLACGRDVARRAAASEAVALLPSMRDGPPPSGAIAAALKPSLDLFTGSVIPEMIPVGLAIARALRTDQDARSREQHA